MPRILGIDFGSRRLGIAISDMTHLIATPLFAFECQKSLKETAVKLKEKLASYEPVQEIVMGLPLHLSGKESETSAVVKKFAAVLEEVFSIPVIFFDERLTTLQVERMLKEGNLNRKKRAKLVDQLSAAMILQTHLDSTACR